MKFTVLVEKGEDGIYVASVPDLYGRTILENLPEGNYTLIAHAMDFNGRTFSDQVDFRKDLDYEPTEITLLSTQNLTYFSSETPLIFTVNKNSIKNSYYILDSNLKELVYINGNTTITGLSNGTHQIAVVVQTEDGRDGTNLTYFSINSTKTGFPISFSLITFIVVTLIGISIVTALAIIFYKKRNQNKTTPCL